MEKQKDPETCVNVVFAGDHKVGKLSLINGFFNKAFDPEYVRKFGIYNLTKKFEYEGKTILNKMWVFSNDDMVIFKANHYLRDMKIVVLVCDSFNENLLETVLKLQESIKDIVAKDASSIYVVNKCDATQSDSLTQLCEYADKQGVPVICTSAKSNKGIDELLECIQSFSLLYCDK